MKLKVILITFVIVMTTGSTQALDGIILEQNNEAGSYMATFIESNRTNMWIKCTGTFIKENYVITAASCIEGLDLDNPTIHVKSGDTRVWLAGIGSPHFIEEIHRHNDSQSNNLAIVKLNALLKPHEDIKPRAIGKITPNRYCTMIGWEGYDPNQNEPIPLRMFPIVVSEEKGCNSGNPDAYCSKGDLSSEFQECGGLNGAGIFCAGNDLSGIVVYDRFCKGQTPIEGSFISVGDFKDWIKQVTSPPETDASSTIHLSFALLVAATVVSIRGY